MKLSMRNTMQRHNMLETNLRNIRLKKGDENEEVKHLQEMLSEIREFYPSIKSLEVDGKFGDNTYLAVKRFQELMGIYDTGNVDIKTWNKLNLIYTKKHALKSNVRGEINENEKIEEKVLKIGSQGKKVTELQEYINKVSIIFPAVSKVEINGIFNDKTYESVTTFQRMFNLQSDGIVGEITWNALYNASLGKMLPTIK
mgnify:CR=1 FL=1